MKNNTASNSNKNNNNKKKSSTGTSKNKQKQKSSQKKAASASASAKQKLDPPKLECTQEEYEDLLSTAASLSASDEAPKELLECARYGELDAVRALLETYNNTNDYIDTTDQGGSTALHKAAANGHVSTVQLLLANGAQFLVNHSGKNTPLHWAAANGHEKVVQLLLNHDFDTTTNANNNTNNNNNNNVVPVDVLMKNGCGRSALTEGFSAENTTLVGMLLEHDTASEEKLLGGGKEVDPKEMGDANDNDNDGGGGEDDSSYNKNNQVVMDGKIQLQDSKTAGTDAASVNSVQTSSTTSGGIIHEFDFLRDGHEENSRNNNDNTAPAKKSEDESINTKTLLIRELPITNADNPFGDDAVKDTTGLGIWCASLVMARWMASKSILGRFDQKSVLELGAGCGVPGLTVALYSHAKSIHVTDVNPVTIRNLQYNVDLNANRISTNYNSSEEELSKTNEDWIERVKASAIDWGDKSTWPDEKLDFVIGSDLIYQKSIVPLLKTVISGLLKQDGCFLYVCPSDGPRDGLREFIVTMKGEGFQCVSEEIAPDMYRSNPLSNGDAEDAFLHFNELSVTEYKLYEFQRH